MVQERLGSVLGELNRILVVAYQVPDALQRRCGVLTGMLLVTGAWAVLLDELAGRLHVVAATDPVARRLEALHAELDEGPCLHAARTGERVLLDDLGGPDATERFPRFAARAPTAGVAAVYSFPSRTADQRVGSLSLCSDLPADLDDADLTLAQLLVDLTAASIVAARSYQQVTGLLPAAVRRLADAAVLEQAKGRLSVRLGVTPEVALEHLRRAAARTGVPLTAVAEQVATGVLCLPPTSTVPRTRDTAPTMPASPFSREQETMPHPVPNMPWPNLRRAQTACARVPSGPRPALHRVRRPALP